MERNYSLGWDIELRVNKLLEKEKYEIIKDWEELDKKILKTRNKIWVVKDFKERVIFIPGLGNLRFKRRRYQNAITKKYVFLLDKEIKLPKRKYVLPEHRQLAVQKYQIYRSYKEVAINVYQGRISKMSVHRFIAEDQDQEFQARSFKCDNDGILWINADGLHIKAHSSIKDKKSYEVKNFVFFTGKSFSTKRWKLEGRILKHFLDAPFDKMIEKLNEIIYSYEDVREIRLIGDGAAWIKKVAKAIGATYYIDKFHIRKSLKDLLPRDKYYDGLLLISQEISKNKLKHQLQCLASNIETGEIPNGNKKLKLIGYIVNNHKFYIRACYDGTIGVIEAMHAHYYARYLKNQRKGFSLRILDSLLNAFTSFANGSWEFKPGTKEEFDWAMPRGRTGKNVPIFNNGLSSTGIYKMLHSMLWR